MFRGVAGTFVGGIILMSGACTGGRAAETVRTDSLPLAPRRLITFTVDQGTAMAVDVSPDGTLLAFNLLGQIFTLPIEGGQARQLTRGPAIAGPPRFAADGRALVVRSDWTGAPAMWRLPLPAGGAFTSVQLGDTARQRGKANTGGWRYHPSGPYAVKLASVGASDCEQRRHVEVRDSSTGQTRRVVRTPDCDAVPAGGAFTPDGRAFIISGGGHLRRIDLATATATVIPFTATVTLEVRPLERFAHRIPDDSLVRARHLEQPRVSPDGRQVVFGAFDRVWLMPLPRGTPRRLTTLEEVVEYEPTWTPDGRHVVFATWRDSGSGDGALYRVRADGVGTPERLTHEAGYYTDPIYTADGQYLVAKRRPTTSMADLPTRGGNLLWLNTLRPARQLVWLPARGGPPRATPLRLESSDVHCLGMGLTRTFTQVHRSRTASSEQRTSLSLVSYDGPAPREHPETLLHIPKLPPDMPNPCLFPSPGGTHVLLSTAANVGLNTGGNPDELYLLAIPPSGRTAATVSFVPNAPGTRLLTTLARGTEFPSWAPDGRSFTYSFGRTLYRYDVARAMAEPGYQPDSFPIEVRQPRDRPHGTLVLRGARLLTMQGDTVIERGDVVVRDRRIVALGASGTMPLPAGAHVIDATGRTIMPGLFDLHNHTLVTTGRPGWRARYPQAEANLAFGVLTSRDPQTLALDFLTLEDLAATGQLLGSRIRHTGPGYYVPFEPSLHSFADMRASMQRYADVYQVGYIKKYYDARSTRRVQQWLVMAAAERGLNVAVHGQEVTDNYPFLSTMIDGYGGHDHPAYPWPFYADVQQLLVHTGITLADHRTERPRPLPEDSTLRAKLQRFGIMDSAGWHRALERQRSHAGERRSTGSLAPAIAAGVRVALGSHGESPGFGTHQELWTLVADGVPPLEALRIGTLRGAEALGLERDLGSLAVGKLADLLVLDGNPLENIQHTARLRWVLFNGRLYDASTLDEQWPRRRVRTPGWWETRPASP